MYAILSDSFSSFYHSVAPDEMLTMQGFTIRPHYQNEPDYRKVVKNDVKHQGIANNIRNYREQEMPEQSKKAKTLDNKMYREETTFVKKVSIYRSLGGKSPTPNCLFH